MIAPTIKKTKVKLLLSIKTAYMDASQYNYATVTQALADLRVRGYSDEFDFKGDYLFCDNKGVKLNPADLKITEVYRFEGASDPDDSSVVYAIESSQGLKGLMIDSYGMYADEKKSAFISGIKMD